MVRVNRFKKTGLTLIVVSFLVGAAIVLAIVLSKNPSSSSTKSSKKPSGKAVYGFDDMFSDNYSFSGYSVSWISDSEYIRASGGIVSITNLLDYSSRVLIPGEVMWKYNVSFYWLSPDRHWILLACNYQKLYRRSFFADYFVYQVKNKTVHSRVVPPNPNKKIQLAMWGNKDSSIGFVQDNDIFWMDKVGSQPRRITNNGKENELFNGVPDWVFEEDVVHSNSAMWFSPDGRFLCFAESNDTHVVWFPYMWYGKNSEAYSTVRKIAYPKAGAPNPVVKIKLVDLENLPSNTSQVPATEDLPQPADFSNTEYYYTNVAWVTNTTVLVWWLNRIQNTSIASICMTSTLKCTENQRLTVKNGWVSAKTYLPPNPWFANNRAYYLSLLPSPQGDKGDFIHLAKVTVPSSEAGTITFLTEGPWEVASILAFDKQRETAYLTCKLEDLLVGRLNLEDLLKSCGVMLFDVYIQSTETSPRERHIYSVNVNTKKKECLSCTLPWAENGDCKYFQASFSLDSSWYILRCLGPDVPRFTLHNTSLRTWYKELEMNVKLQEHMKKLSAPNRRNFRIPAGDYELMAREFLPPDFDENKKYAVQFQVYGGPGSQSVREIFSLGWIAYLVSNFDLIVVQVDGRGTGYRGERTPKFDHSVESCSTVLYCGAACFSVCNFGKFINFGLGTVRSERFKRAVYKLLGEYEAQDVITAGRFMQKRKYVDASKLSIWGWSYGGFLTTYVLSKETGVFKSGIAVAPVTDWRYYDSAYTERYMQLPQVNPDGYKDTSLLSRAAHFSNVDYLIIHGSGDDNVHYQNTAQMVKALTEAEVNFRVQYYTDKDHGIIGQHTRRHLYRLMTNFLKKSLKLA